MPKRAVKWKVLPRRLALDPDLPAHHLDQARGDRQAQPGAAVLARVVEPSACSNASKISLRLSGGNADARVAHARSEARLTPSQCPSERTSTHDFAPLA